MPRIFHSLTQYSILKSEMFLCGRHGICYDGKTNLNDTWANLIEGRKMMCFLNINCIETS
jgi:hypothetical protein